MKTIEEFYKEFTGSKKLQEELKVKSDEMLKAFLKEHDCEADVEGFAALMSACAEGEIDDEDAASAAGGYRIVLGIPPVPQEIP